MIFIIKDKKAQKLAREYLSARAKHMIKVETVVTTCRGRSALVDCQGVILGIEKGSVPITNGTPWSPVKGKKGFYRPSNLTVFQGYRKLFESVGDIKTGDLEECLGLPESGWMVSRSGDNIILHAPDGYKPRGNQVTTA